MTKPDPLDPGAALAISPLDGEQVERAWRVRFGFLVLTNLRVVSVWHQPRLFGLASSGWREGRTFFLFELAPPKVVAHRVLELSGSEGLAENTSRFLLADPDGVSAEIAAAIPGGRAAWQGRRERVEKEIEAQRARRSAITAAAGASAVRVLVKVPCRYCGSLMVEGDSHCPNCGAPQH